MWKNVVELEKWIGIERGCGPWHVRHAVACAVTLRECIEFPSLGTFFARNLCHGCKTRKHMAIYTHACWHAATNINTSQLYYTQCLIRTLLHTSFRRDNVLSYRLALFRTISLSTLYTQPLCPAFHTAIKTIRNNFNFLLFP